MKTAILQVADTGPLDSLVEMLQSVGYRCLLPDAGLRDALKRLGCDCVLDPKALQREQGYDPPAFELGGAVLSDMKFNCDLFVDVKAQKNCGKVTTCWPNLRGRVLWYRINGGKPEHVVDARGDHGDEVNPPCPVLTPNQWYVRCLACLGVGHRTDGHGGAKVCSRCGRSCQENRAYCCWPPFVKAKEYSFPRVGSETKRLYQNYLPPMCLVHNLRGWGYGAPLAGLIGEFGIRCYGVGSPDGLIHHREVKVRLSEALAYVHLKSSDAPGYSLYEALASACPVVCTRRLIWKNRMEELLIPGETCYVFDRPTHDPICAEELAEIRADLGAALKALSSSQENRRVGENGRRQLKELMWSKDKPEDVESLRNFFACNFPG